MKFAGLRRIGLLATLVLASVWAQGGRGTIYVSFKDDISTLDPAIGYDWQNWSIIKSIFDGLLDYEPGTTRLKPHLADKYSISKDGRSYTFVLRGGVRFHNGRPLVAQDVKYSLERTLNPKTQSPGQSFYLGIEGAKAFVEGKAKEVTGIKVLDQRTLQITLERPDASFLHKLALNFAHVVPREEVERWGADFGKHPVGTGAFKLKEWRLGQRVVLERNPQYFVAGRPRVQEVVFLIGLDPNVAFLRFQRGEVDLLGDGIPPARFNEVMSSPKLRSLVAIGEQLHTGYVTLNVKVAPLDNIKVRQALNMAIDKQKIVRLINNRATPAVQILPPLMPGYAKDYAGYPYNLEKAKQLLAEAGFPNGFSTVLYANNTDPNPRIAQAIQQDLARVGVKVELKTLAQSTVIEAAGTPGQAPMVWSGGMAWIADYPDPNNFYWPILSCAAAVPGGWNWAWYCNQDLDRKAQALDAMVQPQEQAARVAGYRDLFKRIMEDAPWIPIFHEKRFTLRSARLGGPDSIYVDPIHIPVNYEEVYLK
ncbi:peptide ABC transporter substrate-binding protein [Thermus scotoductus]|uniref:Peptide ABC transporter substrate-binding protein n=1 Tax=Thermus scotoductus TaxID=37636 RepID=A0A430VL18_THESC|nr:ABC transporter substrate-binding protein [Thermus scotoductus]RTI52549.1 peptide ABC transporter substrate-binding protein [Thermus scotoductus]